MTQTSSPWDGLLVGDASVAPYSAAEWAHFWALRHGVGAQFPNYGVLLGTGGATYPPLFVNAAGAAAVNVNVGAALVNGRLYETDAAVALSVGANASGNPRIDLVVLRVDFTAQTIRPVIKQGTPAVSPAVPALTQSASLWEIPLAQIAVANGFSSIAQSDITDRRRFANVSGAGWLPYAYPIGTNPADDYAGSYSILASTGIAVPFQIAGNMLLDRLNILTYSTVNTIINWGVYTEDLNDAGGGAGLARRIGGREDNVNTIALVSGSMVTIPATPPPIPLAPGAYWLFITFGSNVGLAAKNTTASRFNRGTHSFKVNTAAGALGQTINMGVGTGYASTGDDSLAIRLEGRVFEATSAF